MVIIGVDPHPQSHTAAALDKQGKVLDHLTVENDAAGLEALQHWLKDYEIERCAVEGANNPFARALSQGLLSQGLHPHGCQSKSNESVPQQAWTPRRAMRSTLRTWLEQR